MAQPIELNPEALRRRCDPDSFDFDTTANLPTLTEVLGQPRALAALDFGASIASHDFNLFALGQPGSGKTTLIRNYLEKQASTEPVPPDLCYVYNFADSRSPLPLTLPPGQPAQLKNDIDALVDELRTAIPRAFDTAEYSRRRDQIVQDLEEKRQKVLAELEQRAAQAGFQLVKGPGGLLLLPPLEADY